MNWFIFVKGNFDSGNYDDVNVKVFVVKGKISSDDYITITGNDYIA